MKKGSALMHTSRHSRRLPAHLLALASAAATLGAVSVPTARAATELTVGLLGMDGANAPAAMGPAVTEALRRGILKFPSVRTEISQKESAEVKLVFDCTDERPDCMSKVGKSLSVGRLIYGSLRKQQGTGVYTVTLKQLNVVDGTVEKFITETVPAAILTAGNPELDVLVEKWLRSLLIESTRGGLRVTSEPPGATVLLDGAPAGTTPFKLDELEVGEHQVKLELEGYVPLVRTVTVRGGLVHDLTAQLATNRPLALAPAPAAPSRPINWSTGLRYTSYVLYGLAAVSGLAAIGTWRSYVSSQDVANTHLDALVADLRSKNMLTAYNGFLGNTTQLSSCSGPATLAGNINYQGYLNECQSGNSMARAATGLWITTASLAALGITSTILSAVLKHPEPKKSAPRPAGEPLEITPPPPRIQLDGVAPVVTPTSAGAAMSIRF